MGYVFEINNQKKKKVRVFCLYILLAFLVSCGSRSREMNRSVKSVTSIEKKDIQETLDSTGITTTKADIRQVRQHSKNYTQLIIQSQDPEQPVRITDTHGNTLSLENAKVTFENKKETTKDSLTDNSQVIKQGQKNKSSHDNSLKKNEGNEENKNVKVERDYTIGLIVGFLLLIVLVFVAFRIYVK